MLAVGGGNYNGSKIDGSSDITEIDMGAVVLVIIMMLMMLVMMVICCDDNKVGGDKRFGCGKDV